MQLLLIPEFQLFQIHFLQDGHGTIKAVAPRTACTVSAVHELIRGGEVKLVLGTLVALIFLDTLHGRYWALQHFSILF